MLVEILAFGRVNVILLRALSLKFHEFKLLLLYCCYFGLFIHLSLGAGGGDDLSIFRSEVMVAWVSMETKEVPEIIARTGLDSSSVLMLSQLCD